MIDIIKEDVEPKPYFLTFIETVDIEYEDGYNEALDYYEDRYEYQPREYLIAKLIEFTSAISKNLGIHIEFDKYDYVEEVDYTELGRERHWWTHFKENFVSIPMYIYGDLTPNDLTELDKLFKTLDISTYKGEMEVEIPGDIIGGNYETGPIYSDDIYFNLDFTVDYKYDRIEEE